MKLAYIHNANLLDPSANTIQVTRMCASFARAGADVTLWYPRYRNGNPLAEADWRSFYDVGPEVDARPLPAAFSASILRSSALPLVKLTAYARIGPRLRTFDLLYTRCFTAAGTYSRINRALPRKYRLPVLFEAHEYPPSSGRARALATVDGIVTITRAIADDLGSLLGIPAERMLVAPDGVLDRWLAEPLGKSDARAHIGVDTDRALAVYTGRLHRGTLELLLGCARRLEGRAEVLLVGMPPGSWSDARAGLAAIRDRLRREGRGNVIVRDPVPAGEVRAYQCAADVLLSPYTDELRWARYTSPLKLFEYMAAGRPIVASDLPVLGEILEHDRNAWTVALDDADALAIGVAHLLDHPELSNRLAAAARSDVREHTWDRRARRILDFARERSP